MTAREVLQEIEQRRDLRMIAVPDVDAMLAALRAVLDLHPMDACEVCVEQTEACGICDGCGFKRPCRTASAITDALSGVTTRTDR